MRAVTLALIAAAALAATAAGMTPVFAPFGKPLRGGNNGGADCAACTLLVGLVGQTAQIHNTTSKIAFERVCGYFPKLLKDACDVAIALIGPEFEQLMDKGETADAVCNARGMCKQETAVCRLFPPKQGMTAAQHAVHVGKLYKEHDHLRSFNICSILPQVCLMERHLPAFDTDGDRFSTAETLRGSFWRGKDCDDWDATAFPGAATTDATRDQNCNGISGVDPTDGVAWETKYCAGTGAMGVAALGDSATAHFRIPADYVTASKMSKDAYAGLLRNAEDELDWPMLSWSTGHLNASQFAPDIAGPTASFYSNLRSQNLCNHRDYQNLGVNGAASQNLAPFATELARNASGATPVKPIFLIMSMIGNDVCNHRHSFDSMTTPAKYKEGVMAGLRQADATVPPGSKVLLVPLVDGRVLYDEMHNRIHPVGETNQDVTYTDLYDFLNCLEVSPCWGWMNSNQSVRDGTWAHASALNAELPKIVAETQGQWRNIEVLFLGNLFNEALNAYPAGNRWQLIEPVDGFHPSQLANALIGQYIWNATVTAGHAPPVNPHNAEIKARFGDQGGY